MFYSILKIVNQLKPLFLEEDEKVSAQSIVCSSMDLVVCSSFILRALSIEM